MMEEEEDVSTKWAQSQAKYLLRNDIISGIVTKEMSAKSIYMMRPCYSKFKYKNFRTNLRSLRKLVERDFVRAEVDEQAYLHDKALFGITADGAWHRSDACKLLKDDILKGKLEGKKPKEVYESRAEYQEYSLQKLRSQVYHEHTRQEKIKSIKEGRHPRFNRLKLKHQWDPKNEKVKSSDIFPRK